MLTKTIEGCLRMKVFTNLFILKGAILIEQEAVQGGVQAVAGVND